LFLIWIAVAPDGQLAILPVSQLNEKMGSGYRPYTFGEFQDALTPIVVFSRLDGHPKSLVSDRKIWGRVRNRSFNLLIECALASRSPASGSLTADQRRSKEE
jgi:hypothetical protein